MASIIPGYEYDIFISYRHNDNRSGWVTEFVAALQEELAATIKEPVSVYFDTNPRDGLLETHNVDKSLEGKLKCLIFIPIISQTYCDPKCFAWENEFVVFNKMAKDDQFGRDIRLASGNVASRILSVKIHELDAEDKALLEHELGGFIRGIEFIYKESGVNRPLKPEDDEKKNLNNTKYRNQINKVDNAVKEIITAIKKHNQQDGEVLKEVIKLKPEKQKNLKPKIIIASFVVLALIVLGYLFIPKLFKSSKPVEKSIAVLPFKNDSPDKENTYFINGVMDEILNNLQAIKDIRTISRTSAEQYRNQAKSITDIAKELGVNYIVEGSGQKYGNTFRLRVQLIMAAKESHLWGKSYEQEIQGVKDIFSIQNQIAKEIAAELKIVLSPEEIMRIDKKPTENLEAYNYYLRGNDFYMRGFVKQDFEIAIKMYGKAIESDPDFALAYVRLSLCYLSLHWFYYDHKIDRVTKSKEAIDEAFKIDPELPDAHMALGNFYYWGFLNYSKALEEVNIAQQQLSNNYECFYTKASIYRRAGEWSLAEENYLKAFELDPGSSKIAFDLALTYSLLGEYQEAEKYFSKDILLNPMLIQAYFQKCLMYMKWRGNTIQSRETIAEAFQINEAISDPLLFELNVLMDIYDGNYQKALSYLSSKDIDVIDVHIYINLRSLLYARIYNLMNMPEKAYENFDSARITLESRILKDPDDSRLYSTLGIAYAGLGLTEKAIEAGKKAVQLMPVIKDAFRGVCRAEDLARIYVMVGEYDAAFEQIKLLLTIPSRLSVKLLLLDPAWKPLWNLPEFKKITNSASPDA